VPVGILGCAPELLGGDGFCRPALQNCPEGTVPLLDGTCLAAGLDVEGCAPEFLTDGICRPSMKKCLQVPGSVPDFEAGCTVFSGFAECGEPPFGHVSDAPGTVYVDPSAAASGSDGTRGNPYVSFNLALLKVKPGGRIVLAEGEYEKQIKIVSGFELVGRCSSLVTLRGDVPDGVWPPAVIHVSGADGAAIRNVTVSGEGIGILVEQVSGVELEGVRILDVHTAGLLASGAQASFEFTDSLVQGTRARPSDKAGGYGVAVNDGAKGTIVGSTIYDNRVVGIQVSGEGSFLTLEDSVIEGTRADHNGQWGGGLEVSEVASVDVIGCAFVENRHWGVKILGQFDSAVPDFEMPASLFRNNLVAGTLPQQNTGLGATGLLVDSAPVIVRGNAIVENNGLGAQFLGQPREVSVIENIIGWTVPQSSPGSINAGVLFGRGGDYEFSRNLVISNPFAGLLVSGEWESDSTLETSVVAVNNVIVDNQPGTLEPASGYGVSVVDGAALELEGNAILRNHRAGVNANGYLAPVTLVANNNLIEDTRPVLVGSGPKVPEGFGVAAFKAEELALSGNAILTSRLASVWLHDVAGAVLDGNLLLDSLGSGHLPEQGVFGGGLGVGLIAEDCVLSLSGNTVANARMFGATFSGPAMDLTALGNLVEGARPDEISGLLGGGFALMGGANGSVTSSAFVDNSAYGVFAAGPGTSLVFSESTVMDTRVELTGGARGLGIAIQEGASASLGSALVEGSRVSGMLVYDAGAAIESSLIRGTRTGLFGTADDDLAQVSAGDGLMVVGPDSHVQVLSSSFVDCDRAGIIFHEATGSVSGCLAEANLVGLVLQGEANVNPLECTLVDNGEEDTSGSDGPLPVPSQPMPVPVVP